MMTSKCIKTYTELITLPTFKERFAYLRLDGIVCESTFGYDRYLNQYFYTSKEWKKFRRDIIARDMGCDLGVNGREIYSSIMIHHITPITVEDILERRKCLLDPENVICCSHNTHQAIHYSDETLLIGDPIIRHKNDTCPWKRD